MNSYHFTIKHTDVKPEKVKTLDDISTGDWIYVISTRKVAYVAESTYIYGQIKSIGKMAQRSLVTYGHDNYVNLYPKDFSDDRMSMAFEFDDGSVLMVTTDAIIAEQFAEKYIDQDVELKTEYASK